MSEGSGRAEMERSIVQRSLEDENFRRGCLMTPRLLWRRSSVRACPRAFR